MLNIETLERAGVGQRDMHRSLLHVLTDLFTQTSPKQARLQMSPGLASPPAAGYTRTLKETNFWVRNVPDLIFVGVGGERQARARFCTGLRPRPS